MFWKILFMSHTPSIETQSKIATYDVILDSRNTACDQCSSGALAETNYGPLEVQVFRIREPVPRDDDTDRPRVSSPDWVLLRSKT